MAVSDAVDVVVVGAGPAGSTAAYRLAREGARVIFLDRMSFPRDKPCGGGLTRRATRILPFDVSPVVEDVVDKLDVRLRYSRMTHQVFRDPVAHMTQRRRLDHFLAERAAEAGAEFRDHVRVRDIETDGVLPVVVLDGGERITASVVLGADGANGVSGKALGLGADRMFGVALEGNAPMTPERERIHRARVTLELATVPGGYAWVFPKGDHINVGVGGWKAAAGPILRPALQRLCRTYGLDFEDLTGLRGHHLPMQRRGMVMAAAGSAVVGDAAGLVDPLSGEGITAALLSGTAVVPSVRDYLDGRVATLAGYQATLEREYLQEFEASQALMEIFNVNPAPFVWMLQHLGPFWDGACRMIRGEVTYIDLTHVAGPLSYHLLRPTSKVSRMITSRRVTRG